MSSALLAKLFSDARAAQPYRDHMPAGFSEPTRIDAATMLRSTLINLNSPVKNIADYFDADGRLQYVPKGRPSVASCEIEPLTIARSNSRAAAAGTHLLLREPSIPPAAKVSIGEVILHRETSGFSLVQPMKLQAVSDTQGTPEDNELPIKSAAVDWSDEGSAPVFGARILISRASYRARSQDGTLEDVLIAAILAGVGRLADQALLSALNAAPLAEFSLGRAAAAGVLFGDLRALAGTAASGVFVGQDGVLRASGVPAELTDTVAGTLIGSFADSAILLDREIRVVAERSRIDASLAVTVYGSAAALLPDTAKFWRVAA